jgi:hypothetical protein
VAIEGWYYAHANKDIIFKREKPEMEPGGFVKRVWPFDPEDRAGAYCILIEAAVMDSKKERLDQLIEKWKITDDDCLITAGYYSILLMQIGPERSCNKWAARWASKDEPVGYGIDAFWAMVDLVRRNSGGTLPDNGI